MQDSIAASPDLTSAPFEAPAVPSHREARRQMMSGLEAEFASLRRLDVGKRLQEMSFFIGLALGGAAVNYAGLQTGGWTAFGLRVAGTLATAIAINAFILMMHEGMHNTLFRNPFLNRWVSAALGWTFIMSYSAYRVLHTRHHQYLGDERDPDDYSRVTHNKLLLWCLQYLRLLIGVYVYIALIPVMAARYGDAANRRRVLEEYLILAAVYAAAAWLVAPRLLLWLWFMPLIMAAHATAIRGLTQHGITNARDPFLASRSLQASRVVAFCLLNENYHLEHHLFPEIPSYHLVEVHRLIWRRLPRAVTGKSYLAFLARFVAASFKMDETPIGFTDMPGWDI